MSSPAAEYCNLAAQPRPRDERIRQLVNAQNRLAVSKARVSHEEITAIVLMDSAGAEFRQIVAAAHQTEAPQHTAFPVSMLNRDFLQPSYPNPVTLTRSYLNTPR